MTNSYKLASRINSQVNASVEYKTDLAQYGTPEHWVEAGTFGDCEDYALLKRAFLLEQGVNPDDLFLAICLTETGEGHCVLIVETEDGAVVMDNRYPMLLQPRQLNYKWDKALRGDKWYELSF